MTKAKAKFKPGERFVVLVPPHSTAVEYLRAGEVEPTDLDELPEGDRSRFAVLEATGKADGDPFVVVAEKLVDHPGEV